MSPQVKGGPEGLNKRLEEVYSGCVSEGGEKGTCSAVAWKQVKKDGWVKNGSKWMKVGKKRV